MRSERPLLFNGPLRRAQTEWTMTNRSIPRRRPTNVALATSVPSNRANPFKLYRVNRLAEIFDVNESTIWRWRQRGLLPAFVEIGGIKGLTEQQLAEVIERN